MSEEKKTRAFGRRLLPKEKAEAVALWEAGACTLEDLGKKFKRNPETFKKLFHRLGIKKGQKAAEHKKKVEEKVLKDMTDDALEVAKRVRESRDETYRILQAINRLVTHEIATATKEARNVSTTMAAMKALQLAADTSLRTWRGRAEVLGLDKDASAGEELPDLEVRELTVEQIQQMNQEAENNSMKDDLDAIDEAIESGSVGTAAAPSPDGKPAVDDGDDGDVPD